jgi:hypothetical protein
MLSKAEAIARLKAQNDRVVPKKIIIFGDLYIILAPRKDDPIEGNFDPFWSVDMNTGEVSGYSIFQDGKAKEIGALFERAPDL